jgi:hypothetical protein
LSNTLNGEGLFHPILLRVMAMVNGLPSNFFNPFLSGEVVPSSRVDKKSVPTVGQTG